MTSANRWTAYLVLPLFAVFEASGYYAMRSLLTIYLVETHGGGWEELRSQMFLMSGASIAGTIVAAMVAVGTGPWVVLALGSLAAVIGLGALGILPPELSTVGALLVSFGHGLLRPALYGAAASTFREQREHLRDSLFCLLWMALNAGGFLGPLLGDQLRESFGARPIFLVAAVFVGIALALAAVGTLVSLVSRPKPAPKIAFRGPQVGATIAIAAVGTLAWCASGWTSEIPATGISGAHDPYAPVQWLHLVSPVVVGSLSGLCGAVFAVLYLVKVRVPTLAIAGVGSVMLGLAGIVALILLPPYAEGTVGLSLALLGVGEALFAPLLLSRATGDLPWRLETAVVALWLAAFQIVSLLTSSVMEGESWPSRGLAWAGVALTLLSGAALVVAAFALRKLLAPPVEPAPKEERAPTEF
jgi:dipeptide/tripeptide permease